MAIDLLSNLLSIVCFVFLSSTVIWGIHGAAETTGLAEWLDTRIKFAWVKHVVYDCPVCMPTFWTFWILLACGSNFSNTPIATPIVVWLATAGVNYVIKEFLYPEPAVRIEESPESIKARIARLQKEDPLI